MANSSATAFDQHPDHVESEQLFPTSMPRDPHRRRARQFPLLPPVYGLDRVSKVTTSTSFDLNEGHNTASLGYEVQIPVPVPEAPLQDPPPSLDQPLRCDSLALRS